MSPLLKLTIVMLGAAIFLLQEVAAFVNVMFFIASNILSFLKNFVGDFTRRVIASGTPFSFAFALVFLALRASCAAIIVVRFIDAKVFVQLSKMWAYVTILVVIAFLLSCIIGLILSLDWRAGAVALVFGSSYDVILSIVMAAIAVIVLSFCKKVENDESQ